LSVDAKSVELDLDAGESEGAGGYAWPLYFGDLILSNRELYLEWCNNWHSLEDFSAYFSLHINFARQLIISEGLNRSSILDRDHLSQRVLVSAQPMPEFVREPLKKDITVLAERTVLEKAVSVEQA
jgi:hypothetical protein